MRVVWGRQQHVQRVAWLVVNGWDDAISVDVGVPSLGYYVEWLVVDGNHRLAAAIYRGDLGILTSPAGDMDLYAEFLLEGVSDPHPRTVETSKETQDA